MHLIRSLLVIWILGFSSQLGAAESSSPPTRIIESFTYGGEYFLKLDNNTCYILKKVLIQKAQGWFGSDVYGNPAANWIVGDRVKVLRGNGQQFPLILQNLETHQEAESAYFNLDMKLSEENRKSQAKMVELLRAIRDDMSKLREDVHAMKGSLCN